MKGIDRHMKSKFANAILIVLMVQILFFAASTRGVSQVTTADLSGTVKSGQNQPIPNCKVLMVNTDRQESRAAISDTNGNFIFTLLTPGNYSLRVEQAGFKAYVISSLALRAGDSGIVHADLVAGSPTDHIVGSVVIMGATQTAVAGRAVQDIPENQRNYVNLAQIQVGANEGSNAAASTSDSSRPGAQHQTAIISVNGQPDSLNQHMIDGIDNNDRLQGYALLHPSVEAIASVQVKTSNLTADIGRTGGGALLVTTKSGTNALHGNVFEYLRNDSVDAYAFQFGAHNRKPELRQNQFGGSAGGAIKKDRTFFFGDYEGFRLIQGAYPSQLTVPTAYEETHPGDFSDIGGSVLTSSQIDPVGLKYFQLLPTPNSGTNHYVGAGKGFNLSHAIDARIDHKLYATDKLFVRFGYNKISLMTPGILPDVTITGMTISPGGNSSVYPGSGNLNAYNGQLNYNHAFNKRLTMSLTAAYTNYDNFQTPLAYGLTPNATWGQPGTNFSQRTTGLAPISVLNGFAYGNADNSYPYPLHDTVYQYKGLANYAYHLHNIKVGGTLIDRQIRGDQDSNGTGNWTFSTYQTLLTGTFTAVTQNYALVTQHFNTWEPSAFVADTWKPVKTLTIDAGLRYEIFTPYTEQHNQLSSFDPSTGAILVAGQNGVSDRVNIKVGFHNVSPRLGFSWQLKNNLVLTGSAGIGYYMTDMKAKSLRVSLPFSYAYGPCSSTTCTTAYNTFAKGLPSVTTPDMNNLTGSLASAVDPSWKTSYNYMYNLGIQKTVKGNKITLGLVSSPGRHMGQMLPDRNTPGPNTATSVNPLRPYYSELPGITTISLYQTEGVSSYNAFQAVVNKNLSKGLSYSFNYTWAHGLDDGTGVTNPNQTLTGFGTLPTQIGKVVQGRRYDYGNSNMDVRHRIASTVTYELPFGAGAHGIRSIMEKGWRCTVVPTWVTGSPYNIANATTASGTLPGMSNAERPNMIANPHLSHPGLGEFFNVNAFQSEQKGTIGQLVGSNSPVGSIGPYFSAKNLLHGPHNRKADIGLAKSFPITDSKAQAILFRVEVFNLTNTANFAPPAHSLVMSADGVTPNLSNGYGTLTAPAANYTPREIQFALRYQF